MENIQLTENGIFNYTQDKFNIVTIVPETAIDTSKIGLLDILESFGSTMTSLLKNQREIAGIIYYCPILYTKDYYQELFQVAKEPSFESRLKKILDYSLFIHHSDKPVVSIIDKQLNSFQLGPMLWASHIIGIEKLRVNLPDCKLGLFPGLGVTVYISRAMEVSQAVSLLIQGTTMVATEAKACNLLSQLAADPEDASTKAHQWITMNKPGTKKVENTEIDETDFEQQIAPIRKKTNQLFPGIKECLQLIGTSNRLSLNNALTLEAEKYASVCTSQEALGIMRTMNYGIQNAKNPASLSGITNMSFQKISVLGAGMMGSGIAYEVARAGITVFLKDTDVVQANKGKIYSEKCCDKLIQLGKMNESKKKEMLSLIHPTDQVKDLADSDFIIEAVFEDRQLKGEVIAESAPYLKSGGIFASNTTSLPITALASYTTPSENFVGMHFFSPVDRMPLVEIIRGKQTSEETINNAIQLALKLQKIPIVVQDSPAFFTSRIFFNYLLEAITMLLEGIPATSIEKEAINAGFAVSPLAVLDEISIPLMVHVYDQLPNLSTSQRSCYNYLSKLIAGGRNGRKSGKGFYNYENGTKQIWQDEALANKQRAVDNLTIQNRLLHVMALDSYRCLDEGVLDQPIDGDIGSIMGVGYAAHTGGVFAYIDQVGIQQLIKNCVAYSSSGQQWEIPDSLKKLAEQDYKFYNGFSSNWPVPIANHK